MTITRYFIYIQLVVLMADNTYMKLVPRKIDTSVSPASPTLPLPCELRFGLHSSNNFNNSLILNQNNSCSIAAGMSSTSLRTSVSDKSWKPSQNHKPFRKNTELEFMLDDCVEINATISCR